MASLHEAMLDDAHWLPTSALIDDACRTKGNMLTFAEGQTHDDVEIFYIRFCFRGEHHKELEREYFTHYFPWDERGTNVSHVSGNCPTANCFTFPTSTPSRS